VTNSPRTVLVVFLPAVIALVIAAATGIAWLGKPLRLVQLVTLIGLSMAAGVAWGRAVWRLRHERSSDV
jgi:hypothetical protein